MKKAILTFILIFALSLSLGIVSFAENETDAVVEESSETEAPVSENKHYITEGKCGDGVSYTLDRDGILTISGKGAMYTPEDLSCPWREYASEVREVSVKSGVTSIGRYAFSNHENLTLATVPDSVSEIGFGAFSGCEKLTVVCGKGSAAETCMRAEGIPYEYSDGSSSANGSGEIIVICSVVAVVCIALAVVTFVKMKKGK